VRGRGLFIGIELNRDEDLTPADTEVHNIINRMKEKGVLLSTDGPDHNVIKIKPPIVFNKENADELVKKLDETMTE
jgi:4-aminobutyrate aminotransferase-like enzyme